jgi:hypothetical protein
MRGYYSQTIWERAEELHKKLSQFPPDDATKIDICGGNGSYWYIEWRYWDDAKQVVFNCKCDALAALSIAGQYNRLNKRYSRIEAEKRAQEILGYYKPISLKTRDGYWQ